ncbi:OB-fold nucleic acid binding domain-containing protein [Paenibacillus harenae]|uniref:OB-fold nucleic acid binding domain-containing protein n=1 Tax=Paenibacillus harenae TaxID=306543 RepID=UPI003CCBEF6F
MGHPVTIHGWVHSIRHLGQLAFMHVRDRSGIIQCVLEGSSPKHRLAWNRSSP